MSNPTSDPLTKADLERFAVTVKKAIQASQKKTLEPEYLDLLEKVVDAMNELRLTVEFDHEERLRAIEDFLKEM